MMPYVDPVSNALPSMLYVCLPLSVVVLCGGGGLDDCGNVRLGKSATRNVSPLHCIATAQDKNIAGYKYAPPTTLTKRPFKDFVRLMCESQAAASATSTTTTAVDSATTTSTTSSSTADASSAPAPSTEGRTFYYMQQTLYQGVGEAIVRDVAEFDWAWLRTIQIEHASQFGPLKSNVVWVGPAGVVTPAHYDEAHNFFCQVCACLPTNRPINSMID
jgi:hypothetical protein